MTTSAVAPSSMPHVMNTYGRLPIALERGQGVRVWDTQGNEYLDALAGIAVNTLGHGYPRLVKAISEQAAKLIHCCNYYEVPLQEKVAELLVRHSGLSKVFFCNSGLEANEAAIKTARKYGVDQGIERPIIIVFDHAFHGRSLATMAATANPGVREGFGPLPEGFVRVPLNDLKALENTIKTHEGTIAVMMEVIQGEGGIHPCDPVFLQGVRKLCDAYGLLMITDEIQCGFGRTGKWFAWQWAQGIQPDIITMAKGLASGIPVGATIFGPKVQDTLQPGNHGTTFGGNPLAMRAAYETLCIMEEEKLLDNAAHVGQYLQNALRQALSPIAGVIEVRGQGLMVGVELAIPCGELVKRAALEQRLLFSVTSGNVIRIVPALILSQTDADEIVKRLKQLLLSFLGQ